MSGQEVARLVLTLQLAQVLDYLLAIFSLYVYILSLKVTRTLTRHVQGRVLILKITQSLHLGTFYYFRDTPFEFHVYGLTQHFLIGVDGLTFQKVKADVGAWLIGRLKVALRVQLMVE